MAEDPLVLPDSLLMDCYQSKGLFVMERADKSINLYVVFVRFFPYNMEMDMDSGELQIISFWSENKNDN